MNLEDFDPDAPAPDRAELGLAERWILSRLRHVCEMTTQRVRAYDFGDLAMGLYEFIWGELCDWFLEMAKPSLHDKANGPKRRATQWTLWTAMHHTYRLLHPLMPFLSEELWHALPGTTGSVVVAPWPEPPAEWQDPQAEEAMRAQMDMAYGIRALRAQAEVPPQRTVTASVTSSSETTIAAVRAMLPTMEHILRARINVIPLGSAPPPQSLSLASGSTYVFLHAEGAFDVGRERQRLEKEIAATEKRLHQVTGKLGNVQFVERAPAEVVAAERQRQTELTEAIERLRASLAALE